MKPEGHQENECFSLKRKVYNYFDENKPYAGLGRRFVA